MQHPSKRTTVLLYHMRSCLKGKIFHLVGALVRSATVWIAIDPCPFVFVCDFDPLGVNLTLYDLRTVCLQTGEPVADGRRIVMLNARGLLDDVPEPLAHSCASWQVRT